MPPSTPTTSTTPTTAAAHLARLKRRHRRTLLWPGLILTSVSLVLFFISVWGVRYVSPPRFPSDPPSPRFPAGYPMCTTVGGRNGIFYFSNRVSSAHHGWFINTDSLPTGDVKFWPWRGRFLHLNTSPVGSSWFELSFEVPLWMPTLTGCGLLTAYRIARRPTRLQRGLCPRCAYPRYGLEPDASCPECALVP
ncbi:MAG TPA: hypothetical protein VD997_10640 [Phycisphaerales bacterium]|nr:hypothetical protein [Phycisphaerales bacterium]